MFSRIGLFLGRLSRIQSHNYVYSSFSIFVFFFLNFKVSEIMQELTRIMLSIEAEHDLEDDTRALEGAGV